MPEIEAWSYYRGLPSEPLLVARSGKTPWKEPTGPEAYGIRKDLRPVGNHAIKEVWEDNLALKVHALLDSMRVEWTSTDVVRIGDVKGVSAPVILWIGVMPASLSSEDGVIVASECQEILVEFNITDVDVEIRESFVTRSAGPKLLMSAYDPDPTVNVREPLATTLGLPICAQSTPWVEGTGGFFMTEGGNTERLLLVTTRHVVFTSDKNDNKHFERKDDSQNRYNVTLFGDAAFNKYLGSIQAEIKTQEFWVQYRKQNIEAVEGRDDPAANEKRQVAQTELGKAKKAVEKLSTFYQDISTHWATTESRVLGQVILSPPISVGSSSENYTEDWAVIKIDASKVNASNFDGNAIDLGTRIEVGEFIRMMTSDRRNTRSFEYPWDRLLRLKGTIPDEEMRHPTTLDQNDNPCLMVIKGGHTADVTIGRANDIFSYARNCYDDDKVEISKEWAILPFYSKSRAFSAEGDSGSVIVDGLGRVGGLLTGGAGGKRCSDIVLDITYSTPINFLLKRMQDNGLHEPNIDPVLAT